MTSGSNLRGLVMAGAILLLAACASETSTGVADTPTTATPSTPADFAVSGFVDVPVDETMTKLVNPDMQDQGSCGVSDGYDDIRGGAQVIVTDAAGTTVALGNLDPGRVQTTDAEKTVANANCRFAFVITGIPAGSKFYGVEISKRGRVQYAAERLNGQTLELTIGR